MPNMKTLSHMLKKCHWQCLSFSKQNIPKAGHGLGLMLDT